jgi:hypothetical protein
MKAFWNDRGRGPGSKSAKEVDLREAGLIWLDEVRGVKGNFFGLVDADGNTIGRIGGRRVEPCRKLRKPQSCGNASYRL